MTQDVTAAAGAADCLDEALQNAMDIICTYTGWPVGHILVPALAEEGSIKLCPHSLWHLDDPRSHEAFLRRSEQRPLRRGQGLPGRAWSTGRVTWTHFTEEIGVTSLHRRALDAGLSFGLAVPVFHDEELVAVLEFFSTPVRDPDPTALDALFSAGEQLGRVIERLRAQETMTHLNQQLVEVNEEKNQFLAIASHDLKNPLNTIALTAEAVLLPDLPPEERHEMTQRIVEEAHRASRLIQRLLDVSAIESGRFQMHPRPISLMDALVKVQEAFQERAFAKGQAIQLAFPSDDPLVLADPDCLEQVLENLVGNALKFMPKGPPLHAVRLACRIQGDQGVLEVKDEGPGFSDEDQTRAFGRFVRLGARPTGGESSTGLGLSIVKKMVQAMHGTVELESQMGRGSTFRIALPLTSD